jgi:hypothetical protein
MTPPRALADQLVLAVAAMPALGLEDGVPVGAEPVWNPGGFVNQSFRVSAGGTVLHIKLASDADSLRGLHRWRHLHERITLQYAGPVMRGWVHLPDVGLEGPVCDWIPGAAPSILAGAQRSAAIAVLSALHRDQVLAMDLQSMGDPVRSCAEAYLATFHDRFVEDLEGIRRAPPGFLTADRLAWMTEESAALASLVGGSSAFALPADRPTHQDPWLNNLLVTPAGAVHFLDWDGLALGDPMMDWAMLLGPNPAVLRSATADNLPDLAFSDPQRRRFELHARATLLDWTIDPLADWVEAPVSDQQAGIRAAKRALHERALEAYRTRYP